MRGELITSDDIVSEDFVNEDKRVTQFLGTKDYNKYLADKESPDYLMKHYEEHNEPYFIFKNRKGQYAGYSVNTIPVIN